MRQKFHKFRAQTLSQAYLDMRRALGDEAIVVQTTTVADSSILGRLLGQKAIELTASATVNDAPLPTGPSPARLSALERKYLSAGATKRGVTLVDPGVESTPVGSDARVEDTVTFFKQLISEAQRRVGSLEAEQVAAGPAFPKTAEPALEREESPKAEEPEAESEAPVAPVDRGSSMEEIRSDISEMREMLDVLSAEMPGVGLPQEFLDHYHTLLERGVTRERAASLIQSASKRGDLRAFRDPRIFLERLKMEIRRQVSVTGGIALKAGSRKVVALVGATGVGKTTNLAKLAALYTVQERARVGVITTDTYRVAATDQLQVYANIIDLQMRIVHEPAQMKTALRDFGTYDLVLIDTAGGSPFNREQMTELRGLLDAAEPDEVHLLASASTSIEDLREVVTHFSILRPTSLLFTKLDETMRYGALYCLAAEAGLPVSYFSVGQNVPDDIMPASPGTIAKIVVEGGEDSGAARTEAS